MEYPAPRGDGGGGDGSGGDGGGGEGGGGEGGGGGGGGEGGGSPYNNAMSWASARFESQCKFKEAEKVIWP